MSPSAPPPAKRRLSREDWLSGALEALANEGGGVLSIENLVRRLNVSRGSFYWHFKGRSDFVRQLIEHWSLLFTQGVARQTSSLRGSAEKRLLLLMKYIVNKRLARYDVAVRAWAANDPVAAKMVKRVDSFRLDFVRALFAEMGFEGEELEMRTRTLVVHYSLEPGLFVALPRKTELRQIELRHALLTKR